MEYEYIKGVPHHVFDTLDEMSEHFDGDPPKVYDDWHEAPEGAWVKSDDGRYIQILRRKNTKPRTGPETKTSGYRAKYWVRTVVGTFHNAQFMDTDFEKHPDRYTFGGRSSGLGKETTLSNRTTLSPHEEAWVKLTLCYKDPYKAYLQVWPGSTSGQYLRQRVAILLQQARIMAEIHKCVATAAEALDIDPRFILKNLKDVAGNKKERGASRVKACEALADLLDLKPRHDEKKRGKFAGELQGHVSEAEISKIEGTERPMLEESTSGD